MQPGDVARHLAAQSGQRQAGGGQGLAGVGRFVCAAGVQRLHGVARAGAGAALFGAVGLGRESRYGGERDVTGACEGEGVGDVDLDEE